MRLCKSLHIYLSLILCMSHTSQTLGEIVGKSLLIHCVYKGKQPFLLCCICLTLETVLLYVSKIPYWANKEVNSQ